MNQLQSITLIQMINGRVMSEPMGSRSPVIQSFGQCELSEDDLGNESMEWVMNLIQSSKSDSVIESVLIQ